MSTDNFTHTEIDTLPPTDTEEVIFSKEEQEENSLLDSLLEGLRGLKDKDVSKTHEEILQFINIMSEAKYSVFYDDEKHQKWTEIMGRIDDLIVSLKDLSIGSSKIIGVYIAFNNIKGKLTSGYF